MLSYPRIRPTPVLTACLTALSLAGCTSVRQATDLSPQRPGGGPIRVSIERAEYADEAHLERYRTAIGLMERVLNSEAFRDSVLQGPDVQRAVDRAGEAETAPCAQAGRATYSYNVDVDAERCYTNEDVYDAIASAPWALNVRSNPRWWALWCSWPLVREIGHREGDTIVTQACKLDRMSDAELAGHLIHEYLHVLGFDHPYEYSVNRQYTVPYHVGYAAERVLSAAPAPAIAPR